MRRRRRRRRRRRKNKSILLNVGKQRTPTPHKHKKNMHEKKETIQKEMNQRRIKQFYTNTDKSIDSLTDS